MPRYRDVYELAEEVGGMYAFVVAAAKRAKQLREGRQPVIESNSSNPLTIAIQELLDGKVAIRPAEETDDDPTAETEVVEVPSPDSETDDAGEDASDEEPAEEEE